MPDRTGLAQTSDRRAVASNSNRCCKTTYGAKLAGGLSRGGGHCETYSQRESLIKPAAIAAAAAAAAALTRTPIGLARTLDYHEYDVRHVNRCPNGAGATLLRRLQPPSATATPAIESRSRTLPSPRSACGGGARRHATPPRATGRRGGEVSDNDDYGFVTVAAAAAAAKAAAAAARTPPHVAAEMMTERRDAASTTRLGSEPEGRRSGDSAPSGTGRTTATGCGARTTTSVLASRQSAPDVVAAADGLPARTLASKGRTDSPVGAAPWTYDAALKTWFSAAGGLAVHLDGGTSTVQLSAVECRSLRKLSVRRLQEMGVGSSATPPRAVPADGGGGGSQPVVVTTADRVTAATARLTLVRWLKKNCKQMGIAVASAAGGLRKKDDDALGHVPEPGLSKSSGSSSPRARTAQPTAEATAEAFGYCGARRDLLPHCPRVPAEARAYMAYLESRCLATVGLFRIGSTRRRIRELQAKFAEKDGNSGLRSHAAPALSTPEAEHNPHDVACLLKGYFRRLPDALLCCRLYHAFLSTREIADPATRLDALRYLVAVLPVPNRDLLYSLLKLLAAVASKARDHVDTDGNEVVGNKMDSRNLAAMFGPCILRERGASDEPQAAADMSTVRGAKDAIDVVAEMIDNWSALFTVTKELHDEILQDIAKNDSAGASFLLYTKAAAARQGAPRLPGKAVQIDPGNYVELATDPLEQHGSAPFRDGAPRNFAADEPLDASRATYDLLQKSSEALRGRGAEACRAGSIDSALSNSDSERVGGGHLAFYRARSATAWTTRGEGGGGGGGDFCVAEPSGALSRTLRLERTRSSDADSGLSPSPREWTTAVSHSLLCNAEEAAAAAAFYYGGGGGNGLQPLTRSRSLNADDRLLVLPETVTYV